MLININTSDSKFDSNNDLREVGVPSRNILHGRGVGSKSRIRVTGPGGSSGALRTCKKVKALREHANFGLLRDPLFLAPGMRSVSAFFAFGIFLWNSCSVSKIEGHREHAGFGLLRDPLLLGSGMRSVSSFSLVDVPNDDSESDRKGEALEQRTRPKAE